MPFSHRKENIVEFKDLLVLEPSAAKYFDERKELANLPKLMPAHLKIRITSALISNSYVPAKIGINLGL
jgi:hypothetical protein